MHQIYNPPGKTTGMDNDDLGFGPDEYEAEYKEEDI
jgi:hypothetical protein